MVSEGDRERLLTELAKDVLALKRRCARVKNGTYTGVAKQASKESLLD